MRIFQGIAFKSIQAYTEIFKSAPLKDDFYNNVILQIYSFVESCSMEIRTLLPVTLQKELP